MLTSVRVQNFRCLRDVTLELAPFTVFVGPNASGKTAVADALTTYATTESDRWRRLEGALVAIVAADLPPPPAPPFAGFRNPINVPGRRSRHVLSAAAMRVLVTANEEWVLTADGSNLANVFDTLSRDDQARFVEEFVDLVPVYADVKARARNGKKRLQFQDRWAPEVWYEAAEVSDGTLLAAAFVALGFQRDPPDLVVIEDPDHGLHPYLQRQVAEMLRTLATRGIHGRPIQIVCTTHSRSFLDHLEPEEVRFLSRTRGTGETVVETAPIDNPKWRQVYDQFQQSLGDVWMTGALGGVPGG